LPWASVLRVWDMFMFEGMKIIYRVSLAILRLSKKELIKKSNGMGELMMYLKNLPDSILVPDVLMPVALDISITVRVAPPCLLPVVHVDQPPSLLPWHTLWTLRSI
jgi:hypothetical protein